MVRTLKDLKTEADQRFAAGRLGDALKVYRLVLEAAPLDFQLRLEIADLLVKMGHDPLAAAVYRAIATHDIKAGNPLRAMVAIKMVEAKGGEIGPIISGLTAKYAVGSEAIGRGIKEAPTDYELEVREGIDLAYEIDQQRLVTETAQMAAHVDTISNYPAVVPPVPIFSTIDNEAFGQLFTRLKLRRFGLGDAIVEQGDVGDAVYFLARGEVNVVREDVTQDREKEKTLLARLGAGSLFGEMALLCDDPRSASVTCAGLVDVLELTRADVEELTGKIPQIAGAMARFTRERMIGNLFATNPMFKPFDDESRKELLGRFTGHEVPQGTIFLEQGDMGSGLYVILQGRAEVLKTEEGETIKLADIGPGGMVGEISLMYEEPVSATVRTTAPSTLMFLARELFMPLVEAIPDLLIHFNRLAEGRLRDTEVKMLQRRVVDDDFIESLEEDVDIDDDDIILI